MKECACLNISPQVFMRGSFCVPSEYRRDGFCKIETLVMELQEFQQRDVPIGVRLQHAMITAQAAIELLFRLHSKRILHRDVKPDNFMYNVRYGRMCSSVSLKLFAKSHSVYQALGHLQLIDFGLSIYFKDDLGNHEALRITPNLFSGTPIYASIWSHEGLSSSRRSDLECLGYTMLHLCLKDGLPWANLPHTGQKMIKIREQIHGYKKLNSITSLCRQLPLPVARAFCDYFQSVRALGHEDRPDCEPVHSP
jgi:serine/threonine protein kinase